MWTVTTSPSADEGGRAAGPGALRRPHSLLPPSVPSPGKADGGEGQVEEGGEQAARSRAFPNPPPHDNQREKKGMKSQFHEGGAEAKSQNSIRELERRPSI